MKITFAGVELTDWSDYPAQNVSVNGERAVEAVDFVRAAAKRFFSRGNASVTLQFQVRREFATSAECQVYLLTQFSTLPDFGLCAIVCGAPGEAEQTVSIANAVLSASPAGSFNGVEAIVTYTIQGGAATTATPLDYLQGGETVILRGKVELASGVEYMDVEFDQAFAVGQEPIVSVTIGKPTAGANIFATVRDDMVTTLGFRAEFSAPTPDALYKGNWIAIGT